MFVAFEAPSMERNYIFLWYNFSDSGLKLFMLKQLFTSQLLFLEQFNIKYDKYNCLQDKLQTVVL